MKRKIIDFFNKREHQLLILIFVVSLALRLKYAFSNGMWVDEGRHALVATALLEHPFEYSSPFHGVITDIPPVYPYMLTIAMAILGWGKTAVYSVSPFIGALTVFPLYFLGREMFGKFEGLAAAALLSTSPVFFFLSERILIGVTLTLFYTMAILLLYYGLEDRQYSKYALWALGPVTALALMTKQPAYLLGPIFLIYFLLHEGKELLEVRENPMKYRNLYIGALLGLLTLAPWFLRNIGVCGQPLCSSSKAFEHIFNTNPAGWTNTGGPFFYFVGLASVLSLPVAGLVYLRYAVGEAIVAVSSREARRIGYVVASTTVAGVVALLSVPRLVPMVILLGIAFLQDSKEYRLLWLWIAMGVGFMSTVAIKVPRYIVFVVPALLLLVARFLSELGEMSHRLFDVDTKVVLSVLATVVVLLGGFSYMDATASVTSMAPGFQALEPAGEWFRGKEGERVMASSPRQLLFYARNEPEIDLMPKNNTEIARSILAGEYDYVVVDGYERTRAEPIRYIQQNMVSEEILMPVRAFNRPGTDQPAVIIYEVVER